MTSAVAYLEENGLHTLDDLEARLDSLHSSLDETKTTLDANKKRTKELHELLRYAETYKRFEPLHDQLSAIKWKYKRERFKSEHESELRQFYMARRKLPGGHPHFRLAARACNAGARGYAAYAKYKTLRDELVKLLDVKYCVDRALSAREDEGRKTRPYVLILPADKTTQTNRPEANFRPVCCIRGILIYNLYLPAERRESIVFVGGVDAYYKALIISFSLEHEHAFTRLGAEKRSSP